jgi:hypothetical protein
VDLTTTVVKSEEKGKRERERERERISNKKKHVA